MPDPAFAGRPGFCVRPGQESEKVQLHIIARGKIGRSPEAELFDRYVKRLGWPFRLTELPESPNKAALAKVAPPVGAKTVLLDEKGKQLSSVQFAAQLEQWQIGRAHV